MSVVDYLGNSEQAIYDFNTPWSMAIVVLGFLSAWLVTYILEHLGLTRHVWHLPLFFAALGYLPRAVQTDSEILGTMLGGRQEMTPRGRPL